MPTPMRTVARTRNGTESEEAVDACSRGSPVLNPDIAGATAAPLQMGSVVRNGAPTALLRRFDAFDARARARAGKRYIWLAFFARPPEARAGFDGVTC